jgi:hypothetical protein
MVVEVHETSVAEKYRNLSDRFPMTYGKALHQESDIGTAQ